MEHTENEVQGSESVAQAVLKVLGIRSKGSKVQKSDQDSRSSRPKECGRCGCRMDKGKIVQPRMQNATIKKRFKKGKPKWKIVKCIHNEGSSENGEASDSDKLGSVTTVHRIVQRAKILVHQWASLKMEFDTGAAQSIVRKGLWVKLGSPRLEPAGQLMAYSSKALDIMGQSWVYVRYRKQSLRLPMVVLNQEDKPLFGLQWIQAFKMRSGVTDDKPTPIVVNQQQEIEVQESQLPQQQLREQDLRPRPEVETQSRRK
ncbi:hypothetical protein J437_LFUL001001 [Ladona fulva]|uniref:Uncharacterized protein n=1 Tax=Ladona fulva TaxID=123851 RepID=A0A8K0KEU4_LADFU|nr:hypothetical protein J437_LFUL001001 [Ladona fulva]